MDVKKERLDELFEYEPETGHLIRKVAMCKGKAGIAGWPDKDGYLRVNVDGKSYAIHRLVFIMMGEELPKNVDHINRDVKDNRWENLRPATISQNACNRDQRRPKSGYKGVHWVNNKWVALVKSKGKSYYGGRFLDPKEAFEAACRLREEIFGEYANHY